MAVKERESRTAEPMEKTLFVSFLLFPNRDFHLNLGLGESAAEALFNITQDIITECITASPPQFLLNTHTPN